MISDDMKNLIIQEARTWIGTPFGHAGRIKGQSCDCVGLIICSLNNIGLLDFDITEYGTYAPNDLTRKLLNRFCDEIKEFDDIQKADILLFTINGYEQHTAFVSELEPLSMCHSFQTANIVTEHEITKWWKHHCTGIFRFSGDKMWQQ